jgi:hypothetical protein
MVGYKHKVKGLEPRPTSIIRELKVPVPYKDPSTGHYITPRMRKAKLSIGIHPRTGPVSLEASFVNDYKVTHVRAD